MSRIAIDYNKLLELAENCRINRRGSDWIDALSLIEAISRETVKVTASTPNCIAEIISNGERVLKRGERYAKTLASLATMFGVTRQTLDKWRCAGVINLDKANYPTGTKHNGKIIKSPQYDLKAVLKDLKGLQNRNLIK